MANKKLQIRNSTAEFLIFTSQAGENGKDYKMPGRNIEMLQKPSSPSLPLSEIEY